MTTTAEERRERASQIHLAVFQSSIQTGLSLAFYPAWTSLMIWLSHRMSMRIREQALDLGSVAAKELIPQHFQALIDGLIADDILMNVRFLEQPRIERVVLTRAVLVCVMDAVVSPARTEPWSCKIVVGSGEAYDRMWEGPYGATAVLDVAGL